MSLEDKIQFKVYITKKTIDSFRQFLSQKWQTYGRGLLSLEVEQAMKHYISGPASGQSGGGGSGTGVLSSVGGQTSLSGASGGHGVGGSGSGVMSSVGGQTPFSWASGGHGGSGNGGPSSIIILTSLITVVGGKGG
jgi:hypothetical protein